jgi:hypothetical protein
LNAKNHTRPEVWSAKEANRHLLTRDEFDGRRFHAAITVTLWMQDLSHEPSSLFDQAPAAPLNLRREAVVITSRERSCGIHPWWCGRASVAKSSPAPPRSHQPTAEAIWADLASAGRPFGPPSPIRQNASSGRNFLPDRRLWQRFRQVWSSGRRARGTGWRIGGRGSGAGP